MLAIAVVAVAIGIAFAVPPARSAILDFFHLGGVTVERVKTLPAAEERPLGADLGRPVTPAEAEGILGGAGPAAATERPPRLYEREGVDLGRARHAGARARQPAPAARRRDAAEEGRGDRRSVENVAIDDERRGLWIAGEQHVIYWLEAPPRLAGNVLLWEDGGVTYRIEGKHAHEGARARAGAPARAVVRDEHPSSLTPGVPPGHLTVITP